MSNPKVAPIASAPSRKSSGSTVMNMAPSTAPEDRPHAAHDHGRQEEDRQQEPELFGIHELVEIGEHAARDARIERAQREGRELVPHDFDAQNLRGQVALADRDEGPADPGVDHVHDKEGHARGERQDQVVDPRLVVSRKPKTLAGWTVRPTSPFVTFCQCTNTKFRMN